MSSSTTLFNNKSVEYENVNTHKQKIIWQTMSETDLPEVMRIETASHSNPWSLGNFRDSLNATNFYIPTIRHNNELLGYFVAMLGFEETHLLNITVNPKVRREGIGSLLMQALKLWSSQNTAQQIWLEVRQNNLAAQALYQSHGFKFIATRKNYYPLNDKKREDALIMRCDLSLKTE